MSGNEIVRAIERAGEACGIIIDAGKCDRCPLKAVYCFDEATFGAVCDGVSISTMDKFLAFADRVERGY